ncbi:MAG: hypothetical protein LH471_05210 [Salinibacterium sp.]|nr:hypothetical protein [Salinibacterium sp.]
MEFASYLAGERWSDHPECTHPQVASLARDVNDLVSDEYRNGLAPLIHRVVGLRSDDPHLSVVIAVRAAHAALPIASMDRQRAIAAALLALVEQVPVPRFATLIDEALEFAPDAAQWARRNRGRMNLGTISIEERASAIIHCATVGIALACVDDADSRLTALLEQAIGDAELLLAPHAVKTEPTLVLA